jgi:Alternate to MurJ
LNPFNPTYILVAIVLCFGAVHAIEVCGYLARLGGIAIRKTALAYAVQNAVQMTTRLFMMAMLPLLGLVTDLGVDKKTYLWFVFASLIFAGLTSGTMFFFRKPIAKRFASAIERISQGAGVFPAIIRSSGEKSLTTMPDLRIAPLKSYVKAPIFWISALIFFIYALSVFIMFYISLVYPAYRASITQFSGVTNALASVLLTFHIEPRLSIAIDSTHNPESKLITVLLGRLIGVGSLSPLPILALIYAT